jgi:hypothetical protein
VPWGAEQTPLKFWGALGDHIAGKEMCTQHAVEGGQRVAECTPAKGRGQSTQPTSERPFPWCLERDDSLNEIANVSDDFAGEGGELFGNCGKEPRFWTSPCW